MANIYGGDGEQFLFGLASGQDDLYGGDDNDVLLAENYASFTGTGAVGSPFTLINNTATSGANYLFGGEGGDTMYGWSGGDILYGDLGDDGGIKSVNGQFYQAGLYGGAGADYLDGGQGNDDLYGGADSDTMLGGLGNDNLYGGDGTDTLYDISGTDVMYGGAGADKMYGMYGNSASDHMTAYGGDGDDTIIAGSFNDTLYGGANNDLLWGAGGVDVLYGDGGNDNMYGGGGSDFFVGDYGAGVDYYNLYFDVNNGDTDYMYGLTVGQDYVLLPYWAQYVDGYFQSGADAYGAIVTGAGSYYFFGANNTTVAQLQSMVLFI
jgi:Ca2+-binding RTX toxin-like protein